MDYKLIITGLLSKAYKLDQGEIDTLLEAVENNTEDTAITAILNKDTERIATLKRGMNTDGKFQEGFAKAKKEERSNFEKEIKEKLGIESDKTGLELIETIIETKTEAVKGQKGQVTEDEVKKHPVYQSLESKAKKELKDKEDEWKLKVETIEANQKKAETFSSIKAKALGILDGLKPVLPDNSTVASNQKGWFVKALEDLQYEVQGDRIVVMKDGKVVEDQHGNSVTFEELVKEKASEFFVFQANNGGSNGGQQQQQQQQGSAGAYPAGITKPKTFEELSKITNDSNIKLEDRQKVLEIYEAENATKS